MSEAIKVPTAAEYIAQDKVPEVLFWVGCSGSFDDRSKKITRAFVKLLHKAGVDYAVLAFLKDLIASGKLTIEGGKFKGKRITYHDPCYLGRANDIYEAPRELIEKLDAALLEMKRNKRNGLCCGAGGAQMFKEPEPGNKDINIERTDEALETQPDIIAAGCPFCNTMMSDGIKAAEKEGQVEVLDIAELIASAQDL